MRYAQIRKMDISNGEGIGVSIFLQGCHLHCKNCFNKELWDFDGGNEFTKDTLNKIITLCNCAQIKRFSILGGEPLSEENLEDLAATIATIKQNYPNISIWLYTGYIYETLTPAQKAVADLADILVDGPYVDAKRDITLKYRGSRNQRIIDMKQTLQSKKVKLYN